MAMTNGYTHGPPTYTPYHPPSSAGGPFDNSDPSSAGSSEHRRPRLAPPILGGYQHPGMSGLPPFGGGGGAGGSGGPSGLSIQYPSNHTLSSSLDHEDDANRSRNAKAQRRHREKRKAHVKNVSFSSFASSQVAKRELDPLRSHTSPNFHLPIRFSRAVSAGLHSSLPLLAPLVQAEADLYQLEDSVVSLNSQLEDARRQLAHYHPSDGRGLPPPDVQELHHLRNENMMLRDENAELRRQLNYPRAGGGSGPGQGYDQYPGPGSGQGNGNGNGNAGANHGGHMPPPQQADEKYAPSESPRLDRVCAPF